MKYKLVAFYHLRYEIIVDAESKEEAIEKAKVEDVDLYIDPDYCDFEVVSAELCNDPILKPFVKTLDNKKVDK